MITKEQVMPLLLESCPSFTEKWKEHRAFYGDEELLYIDVSEFAGHLIDLYKQNQKQEFSAIFYTVEKLHMEGDDYVKEVATIGILEGVQNIASNSGLDPEVFVVYLKPESRKWWKKLNDFWNGKK